jgi:hypothetical protein
MSVLINQSYANPTNALWAGNLPAGVFTTTASSSWTSTGSSGLYKSAITGVYSGMLATTPLSCTLQDSSDADGLNCWLVKAVPSSANGGTITFYVASQPSNTAFRISWAIAK